ncbi:MAG: response regulator [Deltaproteobacteria bacterium]|nr:response regulator [Deltaproteobacteria bacterium]
MAAEALLKGKSILLVDDEVDVLDILQEEILAACPTCFVDRAQTFDQAREFLRVYSYDLVVLDIMGVRGFDLLKEAVGRKFPVVMLTAHALTPEALRQSIELGARAYLPKEEMSRIVPFLEDVLRYENLPGWQRLLDKLGGFFNVRFGTDWQQQDAKFWRDFQEKLKNQ